MNVLGIISLFALLTFGVLFAARARWRTTLALWMLLAAYFLFRTSSATVLVCAAAAAVVLTAALLMRRAEAPRSRRGLYALFLGGGALATIVFWLFQAQLFALIGRESDLTGRSDKIWAKVLERAAEHPIIGNGFSSPWAVSSASFSRISWVRPSATIWPSSITIVRGNNSCTSFISCVETSIVIGSSLSRLISVRRARGSRPADGSSSTRICGSIESTVAMAIRFFSPMLR